MSRPPCASYWAANQRPSSPPPPTHTNTDRQTHRASGRGPSQRRPGTVRAAGGPGVRGGGSGVQRGTYLAWDRRRGAVTSLRSCRVGELAVQATRPVCDNTHAYRTVRQCPNDRPVCDKQHTEPYRTVRHCPNGCPVRDNNTQRHTGRLDTVQATVQSVQRALRLTREKMVRNNSVTVSSKTYTGPTRKGKFSVFFYHRITLRSNGNDSMIHNNWAFSLEYAQLLKQTKPFIQTSQQGRITITMFHQTHLGSLHHISHLRQ